MHDLQFLVLQLEITHLVVLLLSNRQQFLVVFRYVLHHVLSLAVVQL